jgi:hypothetical protein
MPYPDINRGPSFANELEAKALLEALKADKFKLASLGNGYMIIDRHGEVIMQGYDPEALWDEMIAHVRLHNGETAQRIRLQTIARRILRAQFETPSHLPDWHENQKTVLWRQALKAAYEILSLDLTPCWGGKALIEEA